MHLYPCARVNHFCWREQSYKVDGFVVEITKRENRFIGFSASFLSFSDFTEFRFHGCLVLTGVAFMSGLHIKYFYYMCKLIFNTRKLIMITFHMFIIKTYQNTSTTKKSPQVWSYNWKWLIMVLQLKLP